MEEQTRETRPWTFSVTSLFLYIYDACVAFVSFVDRLYCFVLFMYFLFFLTVNLIVANILCLFDWFPSYLFSVSFLSARVPDDVEIIQRNKLRRKMDMKTMRQLRRNKSIGSVAASVDQSAYDTGTEDQ